MTIILYLGWALNVLAFFAHNLWCDKDPTHEDVVVGAALIMCVCPWLVFVITAWELFTQKIFHIHHGVRRR